MGFGQSFWKVDGKEILLEELLCPGCSFEFCLLERSVSSPPPGLFSVIKQLNKISSVPPALVARVTCVRLAAYRKLNRSMIAYRYQPQMAAPRCISI